MFSVIVNVNGTKVTLRGKSINKLTHRAKNMIEEIVFSSQCIQVASIDAYKGQEKLYHCGVFPGCVSFFRTSDHIEKWVRWVSYWGK